MSQHQHLNLHDILKEKKIGNYFTRISKIFTRTTIGWVADKTHMPLWFVNEREKVRFA